MNLPHQEPLIFAKRVICKDTESATVLCEFEKVPTLAMFLEAAAQSTAAFASEEKSPIGFLTMCKDIKLLAPLVEKNYHIQVTKDTEINTIKRFVFEVFDRSDNIKYVSGSLTIVIQG